MRALTHAALCIAGLLTASCLSTQEASLGALDVDSGTDSGQSEPVTTDPPEPVLDAAPRREPEPTDAGSTLPDPPAPDARAEDARPESHPDDEADAGPAEEPRREDAAQRDAGTSVIVDAASADARAPSDAGGDAAPDWLSLLCMREPWHCTDR